ncbi:lipoprotein [Virgibacillus siamensis]|uniref:Lipoprotein n=1 Tax=Virgibacillus siamensis TaxID=480071 RepID=A0ABP3QLG7_9BACI
MGKPYLIFPIILAVLLITAGCGETATSANQDGVQEDRNDESPSEESSNQGKSADKDNDKTKAENSETGNEKSGEDSSDKTEETKQKRPFSPTPPPKNAKPLKTKYPSKVKKKMPCEEAHGKNPTRTIPLGQTLLKGKKDLTDGPLQNYRLVTYYGTPLSSQMGILGRYSPKKMMKKLKKQASVYSKLDPDHPAVPTIELIATVAQGSPGPDGNYVLKTPDDVIQRYVKLAKKNDALLVLDVQLGSASVMHGVKAVEKYLKLPFVHLAIDTEYSIGNGEVPGEDLGHVDGSEIQNAIQYVDQMVEKYQLPDKIVMVHQFGDGIITNKKRIHPSKNVEVVLNSDGFGKDAIKMAAYGKLVKEQSIQYGGFKLFYKKDNPLLTPKQVLKLDPAPAVVNYQ